jgi:hypothetical protein
MSTNSNLNNGDVGTLISYFKKLSGVQRSNRFKVDINPPSPLKEVSLFATNVQVPSQVINYYPDTMSPSGANIDVPIKREYDDRFIIDFIVDKNWICRDFFDRWLNLLFVNFSENSTKDKNSFQVNYRDSIAGTVDIYALDGNDSTNKKITLYGAWPSTILPTQLMNDAPNDYLTLTIDMNYRYYRSYDTDNNEI